MDEVFVAGYDYELDKKDKLVYMRIVVTTKRLISLTQHSNLNFYYSINYWLIHV